MTTWLIIVCMGLVTYSLRLSMIGAVGRLRVPPLMQRALRFVPPAVLSAIIFPDLLAPGGSLDLSAGNLRLLAGIAATVVAWRTRNTLLTIGVGMAVLWLLGLL